MKPAGIPAAFTDISQLRTVVATDPKKIHILVNLPNEKSFTVCMVGASKVVTVDLLAAAIVDATAFFSVTVIIALAGKLVHGSATQFTLWLAAQFNVYITKLPVLL
jgi:hypothetical protein